MSRPTLRRLLATPLAAVLIASGAVPLLAAPAEAAATGGSVSPSSTINSDAASATGNGTTLTYNAPADANFPVGPETVNVIVSRTGVPTDVLAEPDQALAQVPPSGTSPTNDTVTQAVILNRANPGTYDITVQAPVAPPNGSPMVYATCTACLTVLALAPQCAGFTKTSGSRFLVSGSNLPKTVEVLFLKPGESDRTDATKVDTGITSTKFTGTGQVNSASGIDYTINTANGLAGTHGVYIRTSDGQTALCPQTFTVPRGLLVADEVPARTPTQLGRNSEKVPFTVQGTTGLAADTVVTAARVASAGVAGVTATNVSLDGAGLHILLSATPDADTDGERANGGNRTVTYTAKDGGFFVNPVPLEVVPNPGVYDGDPDLGTALSPSVIGQGATDIPVVINVPDSLFNERATYSYDGAGLIASLGDVPGLSVKFDSFLGTPDALGRYTQARILVSTIGTLADGTTVRPAVDSYTLSTRNKDGGRSSTDPSTDDLATGSCIECFDVAQGPLITGVTPNDVSPGASNTTLTISGTGFSPNETGGTSPPRSQVTLPPQFTIVGTPSVTATTITAVVNVSPTAPSASVPVTVTNPGNKGADTCLNCLTVAGLAVGAVTPFDVTNDGIKRLTVPGGPFTDGTTVTLERSGQVPIQGAVVSTALNQVVADFDMRLAAPGSGWSMRVVTPIGQTGRRQNAINVLSPNPVLTSITPASASQGATLDVAVIGDFLAKGSTLEFALVGPNPGNAIVNGVTALPGSVVVSKTAMTVKVRVAPNAAPGLRTVVVRNTDGKSSDGATFPVTFTVRQAPSASSMQPSSRAAGSPQFTGTVNGANFVAVSKIEVAGGGVVVGTPTTNQPGTSASAPFTIAEDAAPGARNVIVTNQDGSTAVCANCLTVLAPPTISSISPVAVRKGGNGQTITITGTGFSESPTQSPTVTFGPGVTAAGNPSSDGTTITVDVNVAAGAARGPVAVTVTNAEGAGAGRVTCDACLTVADVPTAPSITTVTAGDRTVELAWTAPTDDGGSAITGYTVQVTNAGTQPNGTVTVKGTSATVTGLTNGTLYGFTVVARNAAGNGPASNGRTATPGKVPAAPTAVTAQGGNAEASVSWTAPDNGGNTITKYTVTSSPGGVTKTVTGNPAATSTTVTGLTNGTAYTFTVVATNAIGDGPASAASNSVTPAGTAAGKPTAVTASVTRAPGTADVSWTAPSGGASTYRVEVSPAAGTVTYPANRAQTTAVVTGLTNGTAYTFRVFATAGGTESAGSDPSAAVTPYDVPGAPTGLAGTGSGGSLTVTWGAPAANGRPITSYTLVLSPAEGTITYPTDRSQTGATITGLTPGRDYAANVTATNERGTGPQGTATLRSSVTTTQSRYVGLPTPVRALDSRPSTNVGTAPGLKQGAVTLDLSSRIPAAATGAVLNVTVTAPEKGGFVVVYPAGSTKPGTSNVNFAAGQTQANEVVTALVDRKATVFVDSSRAHVIVDVVGYFTGESGAAGYLTALTPKRVLGEAQSRNIGSSAGSSSVDVDLTSVLPAGATGAVLNVTVASPTQSGFVVAYPSGQNQPGTSNVNFAAGQVQANEVVSQVGAGNKVRLTLSRGTARLIVDVVGAVVPSSVAGSKRFTALPSPVRALDTRNGTGAAGTARRTTSTPVELVLPSSVPDDATGVVLNVTSTGQLGSGFVVVYPFGTAKPGTSNVNFRQGVNQANEVLVGIGTGRKVVLAVGGGGDPQSHLIADVVGYLR